MCNEKIAVAEQLLKNANRSLESAIKENDLTQSKAAKEQIKAAQKVTEANMNRSKQTEERQKVAASRKKQMSIMFERLDKSSSSKKE